MKQRMRIIQMLFLAVLSTNLFAQEAPITSIPVKSNKLYIGLNFSSDYCYRQLKSDGSSEADMIMKSRNDFEIPKLGYSAGINVNYKLNEKFGIEGGLQFSNKGYKRGTQNLTYGDLIDPRNGYTYQVSAAYPSQASIAYAYYNLDIPVKVNYTLGKRKLRFIAGAGLTTNVFVSRNSKMVLTYSDSHTTTSQASYKSGYNKVNLSPTVSAGIDCQMKNGNHFRFEPTLRYGLIPVMDAPISEYLWTTGLNLSYYFGIK
jgi:hypothetical protein